MAKAKGPKPKQPKDVHPKKNDSRTPLVAIQKGKIEKNARPMSKDKKAACRLARLALGTGEIGSAELKIKTERDARTLYIRFKSKDLPASPEEIKKLHPDIQEIRCPRQGKKDKEQIQYCFAEFASKEACQAAKPELDNAKFNDTALYVDFVGVFSKNSGQPAKSAKTVKAINPTRLFVSPLTKGVTKETLKQLFPKCKDTTIPTKVRKKKGISYGFVQFSNPADAKAAFDAAQNLEVNGQHITVLFSKMDTKKRKKSESTDSPPKKQSKDDGKSTEEEDKAEEESDGEEEVENKDDDASEEEVENDEESGNDAENDEESEGDEDEVENDASEAEDDEENVAESDDEVDNDEESGAEAESNDDDEEEDEDDE